MRSVVDTHFSTNTPRASSQFSLSFLPSLKSCLIPFPPYLKLSLPPRHAVVPVYVTTFFLYIPPPPFPFSWCPPLPSSNPFCATPSIFVALTDVMYPVSLSCYRGFPPDWARCNVLVCVRGREREREREYRCARSPARPTLALSGFCPVTSLRSLLLDCRLETTATTNGNLITKRTA